MTEQNEFNNQEANTALECCDLYGEYCYPCVEDSAESGEEPQK